MASGHHGCRLWKNAIEQVQRPQNLQMDMDKKGTNMAKAFEPWAPRLWRKACCEMMRNSMTQRLPFLDGNVCPLQSIFWEAARLPSRITNNFNQIDMDKATAGYSCTRALLLLMFPVSLRGKWSENRKPLLRKSKRGWMQILGNATHSIHSNINWNLQREWQTNICLLFQLRNGSNYKKLDVNGIQPIWTFSHGYTWPTCMQTRIRSLCFLKPWAWETCDGRMGVSGEICWSNS